MEQFYYVTFTNTPIISVTRDSYFKIYGAFLEKGAYEINRCNNITDIYVLFVQNPKPSNFNDLLHV